MVSLDTGVGRKARIEARDVMAVSTISAWISCGTAGETAAPSWLGMVIFLCLVGMF